MDKHTRDLCVECWAANNGGSGAARSFRLERTQWRKRGSMEVGPGTGLRRLGASGVSGRRVWIHKGCVRGVLDGRQVHSKHQKKEQTQRRKGGGLQIQ